MTTDRDNKSGGSDERKGGYPAGGQVGTEKPLSGRFPPRPTGGRRG